jgi:hypothetical protein
MWDRPDAGIILWRDGRGGASAIHSVQGLSLFQTRVQVQSASARPKEQHPGSRFWRGLQRVSTSSLT